MDNESTPTFAELAADPAIAALLNFTPVPRTNAKATGWTDAFQRMFIVWLAHYGSPTKACDELGKARSGIDKVYKSPGSEEFRAAWAAAVALAEQRRIDALIAQPSGTGALRPPTLSRRAPRRDDLDSNGEPPLPGQILNEHGEYEDKIAAIKRALESRDNITRKLLGARRLYLEEISGDPGKRAAFELLTRLPIDWERARCCQPQDDEPWKIPRMREPEMLLTAENGWLGQVAHGEDKMLQLRAAMDLERERQGQPPIEWGWHPDDEDKDGGEPIYDQARRRLLEMEQGQHQGEEQWLPRSTSRVFKGLPGRSPAEIEIAKIRGDDRYEAWAAEAAAYASAEAAEYASAEAAAVRRAPTWDGRGAGDAGDAWDEGEAREAPEEEAAADAAGMASPPTLRSFDLNSPEFYEAVTDPQDRPWIPNGALPRAERLHTPSLTVETGTGGVERASASEVVRVAKGRKGRGKKG